MWKDILHMADLTQSSLLHLAVRSGHLPVSYYVENEAEGFLCP